MVPYGFSALCHLTGDFFLEISLYNFDFYRFCVNGDLVAYFWSCGTYDSFPNNHRKTHSISVSLRLFTKFFVSTEASPKLSSPNFLMNLKCAVSSLVSFIQEKFLVGAFSSKEKSPIITRTGFLRNCICLSFSIKRPGRISKTGRFLTLRYSADFRRSRLVFNISALAGILL